MKVEYLSFGSLVIVSAVSKSIFEIRANEDKDNINTHMLSGSGKKVLSFVSLSASALPIISGGVFGE